MPLESLLKSSLSFIENVLKLQAKSVLIPLGLKAGASATDVVTQKKTFGSGKTTLIISNDETNDTMKMIKYLEECSLLI